jgi:hemoglobin-like flavoprotein
MRLKESIDHVLAIEDSRLASDFYSRLFAQHPELQDRFASTDWSRQRMMFMMSLQITAYFHRTPNATMRKYLMGLGALHREKGVEPEDYAKWQAVLLDVLKDHHGKDWSSDLESEWAAALAEAIELLKTGAQTLHSDGEHSWVY